jgi:GWxTD domain-containing protein
MTGSMMRIPQLLLATSLALFSVSLAQPSLDSLNLWLDYAGFRISAEVSQDTLTAVEIYYGLNQKELTLPSNLGQGELTLTLELFSQSDSLLGQDSWKIAYSAIQPDTSSTLQILSDVYKTWLKPGDYFLKLTCAANSSRIGAQSLLLKVPDLSSPDLKLSDIQLALEVRDAAEQSRFVKNSRLIWTNPTTVYGSLNPLLYFYAEVYNLNPTASDSSFTVSYAVIDSTGRVVKDYGQYSKLKPGNSAVISTGLNIAALPMGRYQLQLTVTEPQLNHTAQSRKTFFIYREEELSSGPVATVEPATEEEAQTIRDVISLIATPDELRTYDKLPLEGQRNFLKEFWRSRDPDTTTQVNEYKREILRRFAVASTQFASGRLGGTLQGWKSDKGRTYIRYGPPDELKTYPYSTNQKPWEKWIYYNLQGGALFIFEDQDGYGNYELVHSTAKGERRNPIWERFLKDESVITRD